jgi:hypothetical protein
MLSCTIQATFDVEPGIFSECLEIPYMGLHLLSGDHLPLGKAEAGRTAVRPAQG